MMFAELRTVERPTDLPAALRLLDGSGARLRPLAGGTAVGIWRQPQAAVLDLWGLPLAFVEETRSVVRFGATVTLGALLRSAGAGIWGGALAEAAGAVGATPTRNLVTVGGNVCGVYPWSNLPVLLLALDGQVEVQAAGECRMVPARDFLAAHPSKLLAGRRLATAIELLRPGAGEGAAFETLKITRFDYALVSAAAALRIEDGQVAWARLAAGAVEPLPRRLEAAEAALRGAEAGPEAWRRAGQAAATEVRPVADIRAGKDYRREMTGVLVERALARAAARAAGGDRR